MSDPENFTVLFAKLYRPGWGVSVTPIFQTDDDTEEVTGVADIHVDIVRIEESAVQIVGGVPCVRVDANFFVPLDNFQQVDDLAHDDTHDLRTRWFATEEEARAHAASVQSTWDHPKPWESFVTLD